MERHLSQWRTQLPSSEELDVLLRDLDPKNAETRRRWMPASWASMALCGWEFRGEFLQVIHHLGFRPGQRVLELGCGVGLHAYLLASHGCEVVAVDVQRGVLFDTTEPSGGVKWIQQDFRQPLPLMGDSFHHVISINPSRHVFTATCMEDIRRLLVSGGQFCTLDFQTRWPNPSGSSSIAAVLNPELSESPHWASATLDRQQFERATPLSDTLYRALVFQFALFRAKNARVTLSEKDFETIMKLIGHDGLMSCPGLTLQCAFRLASQVF